MSLVLLWLILIVLGVFIVARGIVARMIVVASPQAIVTAYLSLVAIGALGGLLIAWLLTG